MTIRKRKFIKIKQNNQTLSINQENSQNLPPIVLAVIGNQLFK